MKLWLSLAVVLGAGVFSTALSSSQVLEGVRIKPASETDTASAKASLEKALGGDASSTSELLGTTTTCGPTLWAGLKGSADRTVLGSKVVTMLLSVPDPIQTVGRGLITQDQRNAFWKLLQAKYPALKAAKVRTAGADEIRYYWATIPFDSIEGPFFAIDAGPQTFIANLQVENKKPVLAWIDLVGDLPRLADQDLTADEVNEFVSMAEVEIPGSVPGSMYQIGRAYLLGRGVTADVEKGRTWLERAADKGSLEAQVTLGAAYMSGTKLPKDPTLAAKYLLQAGQQQVPRRIQGEQALAQYWVAMLYEQGRGVERSHEKAIEYLQMAAKNGNPPAQFDLGSLYNQGAGGISLDKDRACDLFEKAADQGHPKALHNAAYCYQVGTGGRKDNSKAIGYYTKAAEAGDLRSQRNLGVLFGQLGQAEKSHFWLRVAESSGDTATKSLIDTVKTHMTPVQIETSEEAIAAWLSAHKRTQQ